MIYFDNAASGYYKPASSLQAAAYAAEKLSVNPGRSGHELSEKGEELIYSTRQLLSKTFNNGHIDRVIFTANCTEALNFAIFGIRTNKKEIVTTVTEHNSVLRPLYHLERLGFILKFATISSAPFIKAEDVLPLVGKDTAFVVMNAVSNVTGYQNEFIKVGKALENSGIPLVVDGAQAGGHIPIDVNGSGIACLALAGHKGLMSVQGVGALIFNEKVEIEPIIFGGSGGETFKKVPSCYPEKLEAGTHDLPAILSLYEGVGFVNENMTAIADNLSAYTRRLCDGLKSIKGVKVYSEPNPCGICSFSVEDLDSIGLARYYSDKYSIAVRGGFHCAPLMHKALHTDENGLVRAGLSTYSTTYEIDAFLSATSEIAKNKPLI